METQANLNQFLFVILLFAYIRQTAFAQEIDKCNVISTCLKSGSCHCSLGYTNTSCGTSFTCLKSWIPPLDWSSGDKPIIYRDLDNTQCLKLMNGSQIINGKVHKAVKTIHTSDQWVDLGDLSDACITHPVSCGPEGGSLSTWMNIKDCPYNTCPFSTVSSNTSGQSPGLLIRCKDQIIIYRIFLEADHFYMTTDRPHGWFHLALNFKNSYGGDGITVYLNGDLAQAYVYINTYGFPGESGKAVIGRCYTNRDIAYASVAVDEMTFWNRSLSPQEIQAIYHMYQ